MQFLIVLSVPKKKGNFPPLFLTLLAYLEIFHLLVGLGQKGTENLEDSLFIYRY